MSLPYMCFTTCTSFPSGEWLACPERRPAVPAGTGGLSGHGLPTSTSQGGLGFQRRGCASSDASDLFLKHYENTKITGSGENRNGRQGPTRRPEGTAPLTQGLSVVCGRSHQNQ